MFFGVLPLFAVNSIISPLLRKYLIAAAGLA